MSSLRAKMGKAVETSRTSNSTRRINTVEHGRSSISKTPHTNLHFVVEGEVTTIIITITTDRISPSTTVIIKVATIVIRTTGITMIQRRLASSMTIQTFGKLWLTLKRLSSLVSLRSIQSNSLTSKRSHNRQRVSMRVPQIWIGSRQRVQCSNLMSSLTTSIRSLSMAGRGEGRIVRKLCQSKRSTTPTTTLKMRMASALMRSCPLSPKVDHAHNLQVFHLVITASMLRSQSYLTTTHLRKTTIR